MEDITRFDASLTALIGKHGGHDATYFEILGIEGEGMSNYFPSIDENGQEIPYTFANEKAYWQHKTKRSRYTVRFTVAGNTVSAESALREEGWTCSACDSTAVDVYVDSALVVNPTLE